MTQPFEFGLIGFYLKLGIVIWYLVLRLYLFYLIAVQSDDGRSVLRKPLRPPGA